MLQISNLTKQYHGGKKAVDNLTLTANDGDIFGFIGQNGAGKTTTIRCVVGALDFDSGEILINSKDINKKPIECKQEMAYIPDNPDLYENLTGIQYLSFIGDIYGVLPLERKERIEKYAGKFEIISALGDVIGSYSHGMKQKLAIISALIHKPKLLILDEPFVGLDPKASLSLKNIMKDMCAEGNSIFFSTHVLDVAEKLCNKIAIINNGKLISSGYMEDLIQDQSLEHLFMEVVEHE